MSLETRLLTKIELIDGGKDLLVVEDLDSVGMMLESATPFITVVDIYHGQVTINKSLIGLVYEDEFTVKEETK